MNVGEEAEPSSQALQYSFVRSGCITVMLDAVASVMALPRHGEGLPLLRQASHLGKSHCSSGVQAHDWMAISTDADHLISS